MYSNPVIIGVIAALLCISPAAAISELLIVPANDTSGVQGSYAVCVAGVEAIEAVAFKHIYPPSRIRVDSITLTDEAPGAEIYTTLDNGEGMAFVLVVFSRPSPAFTGTTPIVDVTFHPGTESGTATLQLSESYFSKSFLPRPFERQVAAAVDVIGIPSTPTPATPVTPAAPPSSAGAAGPAGGYAGGFVAMPGSVAPGDVAPTTGEENRTAPSPEPDLLSAGNRILNDLGLPGISGNHTPLHMELHENGDLIVSSPESYSRIQGFAILMGALAVAILSAIAIVMIRRRRKEKFRL
jgi:hypothetical protein